MVGILVSFWDGLFSGAKMLVSGSVNWGNNTHSVARQSPHEGQAAFLNELRFFSWQVHLRFCNPDLTEISWVPKLLEFSGFNM